MDPLKDFLKSNHPEPAEAPQNLTAMTWSKIEQLKPLRARIYVGLSLATATLAMVVGLNINFYSSEALRATKTASYEEETFIVESFSDFEENMQESNEDYAFGF